VPKSVHDEHRKIFEAVMRRDVEMANKQLEKHIQFALREIKKGNNISIAIAIFSGRLAKA
jgi:DNA-binding GntR family transcriptional regulator